MPKIHVRKPFTLTHDDGSQTSFEVGEHEVETHVADHWYVKVHAADKPEAGDTDDGTSQADGDAGAELSEQRKVLESAAALLEGRAEQLTKLQTEVAARETALNEREEALRAREADLDGREDAIAAREAAVAAASAEKANGEQEKGQQQGQKKQSK